MELPDDSDDDFTLEMQRFPSLNRTQRILSPSDMWSSSTISLGIVMRRLLLRIVTEVSPMYVTLSRSIFMLSPVYKHWRNTNKNWYHTYTLWCVKDLLSGKMLCQYKPVVGIFPRMLRLTLSEVVILFHWQEILAGSLEEV